MVSFTAIYYVKERCQDGWYKGSNHLQKSGVFPGNYVTLVCDQTAGLTEKSSSQNNCKRSLGQPKTNSVSSNSISSRNNNSKSSTRPPELPQRQYYSVTNSNSLWSKPIGQHVEALFSRKPTQTFSIINANRKENVKEQSQSDDKKEQNPPSTSTSSATVNLIKRFTSIKRSKSPDIKSTTSYSIDNPVFEDNIGSTHDVPSVSSTINKRNIHFSHPVHVRTGSCPSQLLQGLPTETASRRAAECIKSTEAMEVLDLHPFKGHRERPSLHG